MRQDGRASALESRVHSLEKNAGRSGAGAAVYPRKRPTNALGTEEFAVASLQTKERSLSRSVGRQEGGDVGSQLSPRVSSKFGPRKAATTTTMYYELYSRSPAFSYSSAWCRKREKWKGHAPSAQAIPRESSKCGPPRTSTSFPPPQPNYTNVYQ